MALGLVGGVAAKGHILFQQDRLGICGGQSGTGTGFVTRLFSRKIAKSHFYLRYICLSASINWAPTGRIFIKFDI
jgi:hypothetical protein